MAIQCPPIALRASPIWNKAGHCPIRNAEDLIVSFLVLRSPRLNSRFTRPGVLEQLGRADASITDLAEKFHTTFTGMKKHVGVLEQTGLVTTEKVGRVRTCRLGLRRLEEEAA